MDLHPGMSVRAKQEGPRLLSALASCVISPVLGFLPSLPWCHRDEMLGCPSLGRAVLGHVQLEEPMVTILMRAVTADSTPTFTQGPETNLWPHINSGIWPEYLRAGHPLQSRRLGPVWMEGLSS